MSLERYDPRRQPPRPQDAGGDYGLELYGGNTWDDAITGADDIFGLGGSTAAGGLYDADPYGTGDPMHSYGGNYVPPPSAGPTRARQTAPPPRGAPVYPGGPSGPGAGGAGSGNKPPNSDVWDADSSDPDPSGDAYDYSAEYDSEGQYIGDYSNRDAWNDTKAGFKRFGEKVGHAAGMTIDDLPIVNDPGRIQRKQVKMFQRRMKGEMEYLKLGFKQTGHVDLTDKHIPKGSMLTARSDRGSGEFMLGEVAKVVTIDKDGNQSINDERIVYIETPQGRVPGILASKVSLRPKPRQGPLSRRLFPMHELDEETKPYGSQTDPRNESVFLPIVQERMSPTGPVKIVTHQRQVPAGKIARLGLKPKSPFQAAPTEEIVIYDHNFGGIAGPGYMGVGPGVDGYGRPVGGAGHGGPNQGRRR